MAASDLFKNLRVNNMIRSAGENPALISDAERASLIKSSGGDIKKFQKDFDALVESKMKGPLTPAQQQLRDAAIARKNAQDEFSSSFQNWGSEGGASPSPSISEMTADRNKGLPTTYTPPATPATTSTAGTDIMGGSSKVPSTNVANTSLAPVDRAMNITRPDIVDAEFRELPPLFTTGVGGVGGGGSALSTLSGPEAAGRLVAGNSIPKTTNAILSLYNSGALSPNQQQPANSNFNFKTPDILAPTAETNLPIFASSGDFMNPSQYSGVDSSPKSSSAKTNDIPLPPHRPENLGQPTSRDLWDIYNQTGSAADFVRADQAMQKEQASQGEKRGGAVKEKPDHVHHALSIISHMLGHKYDK